MDTMRELKTLYFITDYASNYYSLRNNRLVLANNRMSATRFSYLDGKSLIEDKEKFYRLLPITQETKDTENPTNRSNLSTPALASINLLDFLDMYSKLNQEYNMYRNMLADQLSKTDGLMNDLLHSLEMMEYPSDQERLEILDRLTATRDHRRAIKYEMFRLEKAHNVAKMNQENSSAIRKAIDEIKQFENGSYRPRVDQSLFEGKQRQRLQLQTMAEIEKEEQEAKAVLDTAYDESDDHTEMLAIDCDVLVQSMKAQRDMLCSTIPARIKWLKSHINQLDKEIDEELANSEVFHANACQGYMIYKKLHELRRDRSRAHQELKTLQKLDQGKCQAIADQYNVIIQQLSC